MLPEVVYAYGLRESIWNGYLKDADPIAFENVKDTEFLRMAVTTFWERYGGKTYEGLNPKLAIYASRVEEAVNEVRPALEEILADLGIPASSILVNVGETKYTKDEDIRNFNDLDVQGSQGNEKQFIILVDKGKEGWNCRSLFGVAMFRNPNSKIFVLQATMRCLRTITDDRLTATVFLSKENYDTLDDELHKNFNMDIKNMKTKALTQEQIAKSFHADTYCFDSKPEKECFLQYITNSKIKEVYFTGMFTANQGDLSVQYYDPESGRIRHYYPDFLAKLEDGSYQLIEVKGDNKIDDTVVKAKAAAAQEMAVASGIEYKMYAGSEIMTTHILAYLDGMASTISYADHMQQGTLSMVAETSAPYGSDK